MKQDHLMREKGQFFFDRKHCIFPVLLGIAAAVAACHGPEEVSLGNVLTAPNGSGYEFDVFMLSEWNGHVTPTPAQLTFNIVTEGDDLFLEGNKSVRMNSVLSFEGDSLVFRPYGKELDVSFPCNPVEDGAEENDSRMYSCAVWQSGAVSIDRVWKKRLGLGPDRSHVILVGSGDNFGSSLPVSTWFDDYPAMHLLNVFGMSADTLGNHSFDRDLEHLMEMVTLVDFPFVISNIFNVPNNLEHVSEYEIVKVPAEDGEEKNSLPVALVGVVDTDILRISSRGRFGTIGVGDYCNMIHTLEDAYNKNARAFVLLSHISSDVERISTFFHTLLALDSEYAWNLGANSQYVCWSRLNVTQDMLDEFRTNAGFEDATADDMRVFMRKDILHNIAMVYGESSSEPILTPMVPGRVTALSDCPAGGTHLESCDISQAYLSYDIATEINITEMNIMDIGGGCRPQTGSNANQFPLFVASSRLAAACDGNEKRQALQAMGIANYALSGLERPEEPHPIWFTEIPGRGDYTARAHFSVKPDEPVAGIRSRYRITLDNFQLEPVFDPDYRPEDYDTKKCADLMARKNIPDKCKEFFEYTLVAAKGKYVAAIEEKKCENLEDDKKEKCLNEVPKVPEVSDTECKQAMVQLGGSDRKLTIQDIQEAWTCLYNVTQLEWKDDCGNPDKYMSDDEELCYKQSRLCALGHYVEAEEKDDEIRMFSTLITNMFTTILLKVGQKLYQDEDYYTNYNGGDLAPDMMILNAGNVRENPGFYDIDNYLLTTGLPFPNTITTASLSIDTIVSFLEVGLNGGKGGFPAVSGIHFSYEVDENNEKHVREIWQTDEFEHLTKILFLSDKEMHEINEGRNCIFGQKDKSGNCRIGRYHIKDEWYRADLKTCDSEEFGCPFLQNDNNDLIYEKPSNDFKVMMTTYIFNGGDGFSSVLSGVADKPYSTSKLVVREFVPEMFKRNENDNCKWESDNQDYDTEDLLKNSLIKRIYSFSDISGKVTDRQNSFCVATQKNLARELLNAEYATCYYE